MPPSFSNMNELVTFLTVLEDRVRDLEGKNKALQAYVAGMGSNEAGALPKTGLLSSSFLMRAFTVWGHQFVAGLIIGLPIFIIYMIIFINFIFGRGLNPSS